MVTAKAKASLAIVWLLSAVVTVSPTYAQNAERPDYYVSGEIDQGWWKAESRILVDWDQNKPRMTGLECLASHDRYLQGGQPPMQIMVSHPVESGDYRYRFTFNLPDDDMIERRVETITIGGRPYRRENLQSRIIPWFGVHGEGNIILTYGLSRDMFRPNETYPWLPIEFLIPQFFEVEGITLGIAGEFEIEHGEYETRYEDLYIDMDEFQHVFRWCMEQVNPPARNNVELPAELKRLLDG